MTLGGNTPSPIHHASFATDTLQVSTLSPTPLSFDGTNHSTHKMRILTHLAVILLCNAPLVCQSRLREGRNDVPDRDAYPEDPQDDATRTMRRLEASTQTIQSLRSQYTSVRAEMIQQMEQEYSPELFDKVFRDTECPKSSLNNSTCTIGRSAFLHGSQNSDVSWKKMVRKVKLNILQYITSGNRQDFVWATA